MPTSGRVIVNGKDLFKICGGERTKLRQRTIGFVFQKIQPSADADSTGQYEVAGDIAECMGRWAKNLVTCYG